MTKVNIFIVWTPLQYFVSESVRKLSGEGDINYLFFRRVPGTLPDIIDKDSWHFIGEWPLVRATRRPKRRTMKFHIQKFLRQDESLNAKALCDLLPPEAKSLCVHVTSMDRMMENISVHALSRRFSAGEFHVRLLPDGTANIRRHPLPLKAYLLHRLYNPVSGSYSYSGDRWGADADLVDRIYWFEGVPHEYDPAKVYLLRINENLMDMERHDNQILVLGNPSKYYAKHLHGKLLAWSLEKAEGREVLYKPHPRDTSVPPMPPGCRLLQLEEGLEFHLRKHFYPMIIGVNSTGLLIARLLYGEKACIVSYGMDYMVSFRTRRSAKIDANCLSDVYRKCGIQVVEA